MADASTPSSLDNALTPTLQTSLPPREAERAFLTSLAADLRASGWDARVEVTNRAIKFVAGNGSGRRPKGEPPESVVARRCRERSALLDRASRLELSTKFHPGAQFCPTRISPRLLVCSSRAEHDVFSFAQLQQSVPSAPRPGRRIRILVLDEGQSKQALMGVVELASPIFNLACRDQTIGWCSPNPELRVAGLRQTMDLSACMAMPPYAGLRVGKLLALLAASAFVAETFRKRYEESLCAIVATCATGLHYPQLNRLNVRAGGLYRRIGATAGYSTAAFSRETFSAARSLLGDGPASAFGQGHEKGLRLLRSALRRVRLDPEPLLCTGHSKGVYLCDVPGDGLAALRSGAESRQVPLPSDDCFEWWRRQILMPLLKKRAALTTPAIAAPVSTT
jgi:hypothetical protein